MVDSDGQTGSSPLVVTSGVTLGDGNGPLVDITGPLDFTFGEYKILPDAPPSVTPNLTAIPLPAPNSNEFTVGFVQPAEFLFTATRTSPTGSIKYRWPSAP